jgi:hypothetical protein
MIKKILAAIIVLIFIPTIAYGYGWTTEACKKAGCGCEATSVEGVCKLIGDCSKCGTPKCQISPNSFGGTCYLVDKKECDEVYEAYKTCDTACKPLMDQFASECRKDTTGKGDYYKIPIGTCCSNPPKPVEMMMEKVMGRTVSLKGEIITDVPVLMKCANALILQNNITSNKSGFFDPTIRFIKGVKVSCTLIIGGPEHLRVRLTNVKQGSVGDIKIGTVAEYERDMKASIMTMLQDSGISKEDAVAYVSYINFKYDGISPKFDEVTPSFITGKMYGANYEINMSPQAYLEDRETLYHEMTHAIVQKMFPDVVPPNPDHNLYDKITQTGAFDEGRAHFFAYLMLQKNGEYKVEKDQFKDDQVIKSMLGNKINLKEGEGANVEASVTAFLKGYYVNTSPEIAWKDYVKTVNSCKETLGHSCQTIGEFIKQKGFVNNGVRANAEALGIKIEKDSTCIIKKGSVYKEIDSENIQLDSGDIECGSRDVRVNDIQINHGGTQYVVSKDGDAMSIMVLEGNVKATNVTTKEVADVTAGNKVAYSSASAKFSAPEKIDVTNVEKFWEATDVTSANNETSTGKIPNKGGSSIVPIIVVAVMLGIGAMVFTKRLTKKA